MTTGNMAESAWAGHPNPGSPEAVEAGCTCPVIDNCHGRFAPWQPDGWWITWGCPVHDHQNRTGGDDD